MRQTPLTEILIGTTALTEDQLDRAEALRQQKGLRLEEVLVQQNLISEEELLQAQSQQLGIAYWKALPESEFDPALMREVPLAFARQHKIVPIRYEDGSLGAEYSAYQRCRQCGDALAGYGYRAVSHFFFCPRDDGPAPGPGALPRVPTIERVTKCRSIRTPP